MAAGSFQSESIRPLEIPWPEETNCGEFWMRSVTVLATLDLKGPLLIPRPPILFAFKKNCRYAASRSILQVSSWNVSFCIDSDREGLFSRPTIFYTCWFFCRFAGSGSLLKVSGSNAWVSVDMEALFSTNPLSFYMHLKKNCRLQWFDLLYRSHVHMHWSSLTLRLSSHPPPPYSIGIQNEFAGMQRVDLLYKSLVQMYPSLLTCRLSFHAPPRET